MTAMLAYIHCDGATRHVRQFMVKRTLNGLHNTHQPSGIQINTSLINLHPALK